MVEDRPKRVECLTCHGQHAYRPDEPGTRTRKSSSKASHAPDEEKSTEKKRGKSKRAQKNERDLWKETLAKRDLGLAKPYIMTSSYETDDIIDHSKFGMGIVTHVITPQKMEVLFEEGYKFMVLNFTP
jgi:hypothetical protein